MVERFVRDEEAAGSNPVTSILFIPSVEQVFTEGFFMLYNYLMLYYNYLIKLAVIWQIGGLHE